MSESLLALAIPLDPDELRQVEDPAHREQVRMSVWDTATHFLKPLLDAGEITSFQPADMLWGVPTHFPYGVMLGRWDAKPLIYSCAAAWHVQDECVARHMDALLSCGDVLDKKEFGPISATVHRINWRDEKATAHIKWLEGLEQGHLMPGCTFYHLGLRTSKPSDSIMEDLALKTEKYALCALIIGRPDETKSN